MNNIAAIFDVLTNNTKDVEDIIARFGGIGNVIRAAPSLFRIMQTISAHKSPVEAAENASRALLYNEETKHKIEEFQRKHGLEVDGLVGNQTWSKVETLLAKRGGV